MLMPSMLILTLMLVFPSAQALALTQSPRVLMLPHRDMSLITDMLDMDMATILARGLLMPMLMPTMLILMLMLVFPLAQALVLTQSPRGLMLPLRDMYHTTDTLDMAMDTTLARGLLMPKLMPTMLTLMLMPVFPSDPALVLTPSPRVLMLPPRDMCLTTVMLGMAMEATTLASNL